MNFTFEQQVRAPLEKVFAFHENPIRLEILHAGWSKVRILQHCGNIHCGSETWVEIMIAPLFPVVIGFQHTIYKPPLRFGERLIHGPLKEFEHIHEFYEVEQGTLIRDFITMNLPLKFGAEIGMSFLAPLIRSLFTRRAEAYQRILAEIQ